MEELRGGRQGAAAEPRGAEETFGRLMLAIAVVILAARAFGVALGKLGQPRVMGEIIAGILLGPTLLGAVAPEVKDYLFPPDIIPLLSAAASIGLAFYLFLVGMELDPTAIRERATEAAFISNTSVAFPMALGLLVALPVYELLAPDADYLPFALFMGVAMSITAFPVLARILVERRMLRRPVGALAMAGAAIDDVTAWGLLALATAVAGAGSGIDALVVVGLAGVFTAALFLGGRPILRRLSTAFDELGHIPPLWVAGIFVSVLLAAFVAQQIGIAPIFGAFIVGLIMPRHAGLTEDMSRRLEDFVVTVLLPLFFVVTGLKVEIGCARPLAAVGDRPRSARRRGRRQMDRRDARGLVRRLQLARLVRARRAHEHPRPDRADRAQHRARARPDLDGPLHDARADGDRDDVHGRPGAAAPRPARRALGAAGGGLPAVARRGGGGRAGALDPGRAAGRPLDRRPARPRGAARTLAAAAGARRRPAAPPDRALDRPRERGPPAARDDRRARAAPRAPARARRPGPHRRLHRGGRRRTISFGWRRSRRSTSSS